VQPEAIEIEIGRNTDAGAKGGKTRLLCLESLDGRTRAAQAVRSLKDQVTADLGGEDRLSTLERAAINNVAMASVMIEDLSAKWLLGQDVNPTELATLVNTFNRSADKIGWTRRSRDVTPDLNAYLASKAAGKATQ